MKLMITLKAFSGFAAVWIACEILTSIRQSISGGLYLALYHFFSQLHPDRK